MKLSVYNLTKGIIKLTWKVSGIDSLNSDLKKSGINITHQASRIGKKTWQVIEAKLDLKNEHKS